ncbi:BACON domain-containing protein [Paludibaculum fermentans]|uniref:BACON domain-containing protein n=1 Tax=Paludibaculum fermentans TaxID=1473598 RepID=UPI003EBC01EF
MRRSPAAAVATAPELRDLYEGPVEVSVADDFEHGVSTTAFRFRHAGHDVTAYQQSSTAPKLQCGDTLRVEGVRLGDTMAVSRAVVTARGAAEADCGTTGPQRVAVILARFPGSGGSLPSAGDLQRRLFDENGLSANTWYREMSYGKLSLSGAVFGPYTLDRSYTCAESGLMQAAAIRAADRDINFQQFQRYILVFPFVAGCSWGGMGTLGCGELQSSDGTVRASWIWANYGSSLDHLLNLLLHEFGHNLGLGHSRLLRFPGVSLEADNFRAMPVEYGDSAAMMGNSWYGDFAAGHKAQMGWLESGTDVVSVEADGEFTIPPLGNDSGVRALRVRRRVGVDQWIWLEFRRWREGSVAAVHGATRSGMDGVLVRLEGGATETWTNLLDMTPPTLDEARLDSGAGSDAQMELMPGATWVDPHSDLTITVGEIGEDGISVAVRYAERCAVPERLEINASAEEQVVSLPVAVAEGCDWQVTSGRSWLSIPPAQEEATEGGAPRAAAVVHLAAVTDNLDRSGVVSVGRHTVRVNQRGPVHEMAVLSVSPPGSELPVGSPVPFLIYLRDQNGVSDLQAIQLSVLPREGSTAAPCYFRYSTVRRVVEVSYDGNEYRDSESPSTGFSGACALEGSTYQPNGTDLIFWFSLLFAGDVGEGLTFSVRAEDAHGVAGPWVKATEMNAVNRCRVLPKFDYFTYLSGGGTNNSMPIMASTSPCPWTASSDSAWLQVATAAGNDSGDLRFTVAANTSPVTREGHIFVNGTPVRFTQFGLGEIQPYYVTLRPTETVVSGLGGVGTLAFYYGLSDLVPAESQDSWLQVVRVERSADQKQVVFLFEANPEPMPRLGSIVVGGKRFSVLQTAGTGQ